jgi:hypothetical protein
VPWSARFHDPIQPPKGKPLATLKDAADYVMRLPKRVHDAPHCQLAMEQLIDAAEGRNFIMHARIAVLKALNCGCRGYWISRTPLPVLTPPRSYG